jgi:hypothetical protein
MTTVIHDNISSSSTASRENPMILIFDTAREAWACVRALRDAGKIATPRATGAGFEVHTTL